MSFFFVDSGVSCWNRWPIFVLLLRIPNIYGFCAILFGDSTISMAGIVVVHTSLIWRANVHTKTVKRFSVGRVYVEHRTWRAKKKKNIKPQYCADAGSPFVQVLVSTGFWFVVIWLERPRTTMNMNIDCVCGQPIYPGFNVVWTLESTNKPKEGTSEVGEQAISPDGDRN